MRLDGLFYSQTVAETLPVSVFKIWLPLTSANVPKLKHVRIAGPAGHVAASLDCSTCYKQACLELVTTSRRIPTDAESLKDMSHYYANVLYYLPFYLLNMLPERIASETDANVCQSPWKSDYRYLCYLLQKFHCMVCSIHGIIMSLHAE